MIIARRPRHVSTMIVAFAPFSWLTDLVSDQWWTCLLVFGAVGNAAARTASERTPFRHRSLRSVIRTARTNGHLRAALDVPGKTLALDLSYHLVYGAGVAGAVDALD